MTTTNEKNIATFLHLSALTQYIIPFGNYIFPIVIWSSKKNESEFVDQNGKQVLNFQLSIFLYMVVLCLIAIPIFIYSIFKNVPMNDIDFDRHYVIENLSAGNITGITILGIIAVLLFFFLKVIEFILIIYAAVKASNGEAYKYPLSIPFFK
ncbi:DUF4870 domain-containing protein [Flavobacterium sp. IMCC34852]|uniref:DUF4870 domain-containing protein n=1 Tax=Flavobacterium rivulicola TaxID=2732161 RepID=A0A7Y3VZ84_9FLAO|nr:DUF4870 domain-containing protein [Flavobacterium sp. IMCC34852]NNT72272.1 DUF4870 domain-containing protein [Flavobacterium sp. IMCC34852]